MPQILKKLYIQQMLQKYFYSLISTNEKKNIINLHIIDIHSIMLFNSMPKYIISISCIQL